jgi:hypothetical protein
MGYLKGYKNISKAANHNLELPPEEVFFAFQAQLFKLIHLAYFTIKTPEPFKENPDETLISIQLLQSLKIISSKEGIPLSVTIEHYEISDAISLGIKSLLSAKRYDIYFESWYSKYPIEFGVEAKLLIENNFMNRVASTLIREYVSNSGMGKYINGIYKKRGCMIGYIVEGSIPNIIRKINTRIEKVMDSKQYLVKDCSLKYKHKEIYKSRHQGKLNYDLYHLCQCKDFHESFNFFFGKIRQFKHLFCFYCGSKFIQFELT